MGTMGLNFHVNQMILIYRVVDKKKKRMIHESNLSSE